VSPLCPTFSGKVNGCAFPFSSFLKQNQHRNTPLVRTPVRHNLSKAKKDLQPVEIQRVAGHENARSALNITFLLQKYV